MKTQFRSNEKINPKIRNRWPLSSQKTGFKGFSSSKGARRVARQASLTRSLLGASFLVLLSGCGSFPREREQYYLYMTPETSPFQATKVSTVEAARNVLINDCVANGDVILSRSFCPADMLPSLFTSDFSYYTHAGVIGKEIDGFYVYEAMRSFQPTAEEIGNRDLLNMWKGKMQRTRLVDYLTRYPQSMVFRGKNPEKNARLAEILRNWVNEGLPFDNHFDLHTPEVYCAEAPFKAMVEAEFSPIPSTSSIRENQDVKRLLEGLGIKATEFVTADSLVKDMDPVVLLFRGQSETLSLPLKEAMEYLIEQIGERDRITNCLIWDDQEMIVFSPQVLLYFDMVSKFFNKYPDISKVNRAEIYRKYYRYAFREFDGEVEKLWERAANGN